MGISLEFNKFSLLVYFNKSRPQITSLRGLLHLLGFKLLEGSIFFYACTGSGLH